MKYSKLTAANRGAIELLLRKQYTYSQIAKELGVHRSTICREVKNRSTPSGYFADIAQINRDKLKKNSKKRKRIEDNKLRNYIQDTLQLGWSPEQISGRMKYENNPNYVCHETVYRFIYSDEQFVSDKIYQYLRYGRKKRRKQNGRSVHKYKIPNRVSIHDRPSIVSKREEIGHWESDSVIYPHKKAVNTSNELFSGIVAFTKLNAKTAKNTADAVNRKLKDYVVKTITIDNGTEWFKHEEISKELGVDVYFCDPYSSWQRGANENVNMLLRRYLPKRTNIDNLTQEELDDIAFELNNRPRKRLGFRTPLEVYEESVWV